MCTEGVDPPQKRFADTHVLEAAHDLDALRRLEAEALLRIVRLLDRRPATGCGGPLGAAARIRLGSASTRA